MNAYVSIHLFLGIILLILYTWLGMDKNAKQLIKGGLPREVAKLYTFTIPVSIIAYLVLLAYNYNENSGNSEKEKQIKWYYVLFLTSAMIWPIALKTIDMPGIPLFVTNFFLVAGLATTAIASLLLFRSSDKCRSSGLSINIVVFFLALQTVFMDAILWNFFYFRPANA